jgi:hyperosmotically inducible periplasmic protein
MKYKLLALGAVCASMLLALGCAGNRQSADVKLDVEKALTQAGFTNIKVSQDRDKGVVTLSGDVQTDVEKQRAGDVAKSMSGSLVIANEIGIRPSGFESEAKHIDASLDTAIEKNFEAILIGKQLDKDIKYAAENGVLTLKGDVGSQGMRHEVELLAAAVPNVKQVVNELQIKDLKATSRK